jgi:hypothetical protein
MIEHMFEKYVLTEDIRPNLAIQNYTLIKYCDMQVT